MDLTLNRGYAKFYLLILVSSIIFVGAFKKVSPCKESRVTHDLKRSDGFNESELKFNNERNLKSIWDGQAAT